MDNCHPTKILLYIQCLPASMPDLTTFSATVSLKLGIMYPIQVEV